MGLERIPGIIRRLRPSKDVRTDDFCKEHGLSDFDKEVLVSNFGNRLDPGVAEDLKNHIVIFKDPHARALYARDLGVLEGSKAS